MLSVATREGDVRHYSQAMKEESRMLILCIYHMCNAGVRVSVCVYVREQEERWAMRDVAEQIADFMCARDYGKERDARTYIVL